MRTRILSTAFAITLLAAFIQPASAVTDPSGTIPPEGDAAVIIEFASILPSGEPGPTYICGGVLVSDRVVMTNAGCLDNDALPGINEFTAIRVSFGLNGNDLLAPIYGVAMDGGEFVMEVYRYYNVPTVPGNGEIGLLLLDADPGVTPVTVNTEALGAGDVNSLEVTIIGLGSAGADSDTTRQRRAVTALLRRAEFDFFEAGTATATTCAGDRGAPLFADVSGDAGLELIGITGRQTLVGGQCNENNQRVRVDRIAEDFIIPFIERHDGIECPADNVCTAACSTVDADCECAYGGDGQCDTGCTTRDWDCGLGTFAGDGCAADEDCENLGACVAATDDATHSYCDRACGDSEVPCPADMACTAGRCAFTGISRGSPGAECAAPSGCRSGYCEEDICSITCDPANPVCPEGLNNCVANDEGTENICRGRILTGDGGFCTVSSGGASSGVGAFMMMLLGALFFVGRRRRA